MKSNYDILIVGAGLVGISFALSLVNTPLRIALSETNPIKAEIIHDVEGRSLALTYGSSQILQNIHAWSLLKPHATPIKTVHVSDRGHFGMTRIQAQDEGLSALGYVIPAAVLGATLNQLLLHQKEKLNLLNPSEVIDMQAHADGWQVNLKIGGDIKTIFAKLVIAADGTHSALRQLLNIQTETHDYGQTAIATAVTLNRSHNNIAYERFIEGGAIAMLPRENQHCGLIWTGENTQIEKLAALTDQEFLQIVQQYFGYRLGKLLTLGKRFVYPLKMLHAKEQVRDNFILLGNAAHTIHPIAAQGFNLGLSDVAALAKLLTEGTFDQNLIGIILKEYAQQCEQRQQWTMKFTDGLTRWFAMDFLPLNIARNMGLLALDLVPPIKRRLAKKLVGI